jgi:arylsulfatase A-like enzyme
MDIHSTARVRSYFHKNNVFQRINLAMLLDKMERQPNKISEEEKAKTLEIYDDELKILDEAIGNFLTQLENIGISKKNTYIILTADHGEEFGEHGGFDHPSFEGVKLYDELLRVPLIICGPTIPNNKIIKAQVSLLDLGPTILNLSNIESAENFKGNSLIPLLIDTNNISHNGVISTYSSSHKQLYGFSYRKPNEKLIVIFNQQQKEYELYDLLQDPTEQHNLAEQYKVRVNKLETELFNQITEPSSITKRTHDLPHEIDPKIKERLRQLGYV